MDPSRVHISSLPKWLDIVISVEGVNGWMWVLFPLLSAWLVCLGFSCSVLVLFLAGFSSSLLVGRI